MTPDISEFTYGFALTNELVGWMALSAVPIFPSLIEEGKSDGGYDVAFDRPGTPLYLQFKRSHVMKMSSAHEIKNLKLPLSIPFHRFAITERNRSLQHLSLVNLDNGVNDVLYAAPRFHTREGINAAWTDQRVADRSIFISPADIGVIHDDLRHTISFDRTSAYFCSEPRRIEPISIERLRSRLTEKLQRDDRPVRLKLEEWLQDLRIAAQRAQDALLDLEGPAPPAIDRPRRQAADLPRREIVSPAESPINEGAPAGEAQPMAIRGAKTLDQDTALLRALSDEAQGQFNAQFIVVQPI